LKIVIYSPYNITETNKIEYTKVSIPEATLNINLYLHQIKIFGKRSVIRVPSFDPRLKRSLIES